MLGFLTELNKLIIYTTILRYNVIESIRKSRTEGRNKKSLEAVIRRQG
jgi:hypothetical protein